VTPDILSIVVLLQENPGEVPRSDRNRLLQNRFQFFSRPTVRRCTVSTLKTQLSDPQGTTQCITIEISGYFRACLI
jgi:hypothetical protein